MGIDAAAHLAGGVRYMRGDAMAWNPSPEVAIARDAAAKLKADRCVLLYTLPDGRIGYASYGQTKQLCSETKQLADAVYGKAMDWFRDH